MDISVIGLGLMGGSMAKAAKKYTACRVFGLDINREVMDRALLCGAIDGEADAERLGSSELILLALRPASAVKWLRDNASKLKEGTLVTDLCGVKRSVGKSFSETARAHALRYVGGHPMAGRERGGFSNSSAELFRGSQMLLVPPKEIDPETLEELELFFQSIGFSKMVFTDSEKHDSMIAYTSQLAHILASAYMLSPKAADQAGYSGGAFRDMTRVANMDCDMWTELFIENADLLSEDLSRIIGELERFKQAVDSRDSESLSLLLDRGKAAKEASEAKQ